MHCPAHDSIIEEGEHLQPKYQAIASALRAQIESGKFDETNMLPTEFALIDEYQVSRQTIRQALSLLEQEGYIEKRRGSGSHILHTPSSHPYPVVPQRTIAVVTTYISNYIFPTILREIETVLSQNNCMSLLFATQNQISIERKVLLNLLSTQVDGIIIEGTKTAFPNPNLDLIQALSDKGIPVVFINGCYSQLPNAISVLDDNVGGGKMLVEYLARKNHKKIAGIFKYDDIQGHGRYLGYADGLRSCGLTLNDDMVLWYSTDVTPVVLSDQIFLPALARWREAGCTAIVCYNDDIACQVLPFLFKAGLSVPDDISIVSFDNSQLCELATPPLTSLSHGQENVGRTAANKLLSLLSGTKVISELISWTLIERASG